MIAARRLKKKYRKLWQIIEKDVAADCKRNGIATTSSAIISHNAAFVACAETDALVKHLLSFLKV